MHPRTTLTVSVLISTFTDGVGKCAQDVCDEAAKALGLQNDVDTHPSAVQFRMGGAKGLLVAWPNVKKREVYLRPSQIKFESDSKQLHAVRVSRECTTVSERGGVL